MPLLLLPLRFADAVIPRRHAAADYAMLLSIFDIFAACC